MSDYDYSDSFELDISGDSSLTGEEKDTVAIPKHASEGGSSSQPSLTQDAAVTHHTPPPWPSKKPPTAGIKASGSNSSRVEPGRVQNKIYKAQHLIPKSKERVGQALETTISPTSSSSPNQMNRPLQFKEVAGRVHILQSASQGFKTSRELRDIAHKEWLAKKESKKMQEKELIKSENEKRVVASEEKRKREVSKYWFTTVKPLVVKVSSLLKGDITSLDKSNLPHVDL